MKWDVHETRSDNSRHSHAAGSKKDQAARNAMARRRLEQYREEKQLREQLYDAFIDERSP